MIGIYRILNKTNNKSYIGSSKNIEGRWKKHKKLLKLGIHWNKHLQNAWNKDGKNNFDFIIIEETNNLLEREQHYINIEGHYNKENPTSNGTRGMHLSKEHKRKLSEALKKVKITWGNKISESLKGRKLSLESRQKIANTLKGRSLSKEHREKITNGMLNSKRIYKTGYHLSLEHRQKISKGGKGVKHVRTKNNT